MGVEDAGGRPFDHNPYDIHRRIPKEFDPRSALVLSMTDIRAEFYEHTSDADLLTPGQQITDLTHLIAAKAMVEGFSHGMLARFQTGKGRVRKGFLRITYAFDDPDTVGIHIGTGFSKYLLKDHILQERQDSRRPDARLTPVGIKEATEVFNSVFSVVGKRGLATHVRVLPWHPSQSGPPVA